jgi:hypothetical protein
VKEITALALMATGSIGRQMVDRAAGYQGFFERAQALGLSTDQARWIAERERSSGDFTDLLWRLDERLRLFAENGYLVVILNDVLIPGEPHPPFSPWTVLNGPQWMTYGYAKHFAGLGHDQQRTLVMAAIELTEQLGGPPQGWLLERAMAAVMPHVEGA